MTFSMALLPTPRSGGRCPGQMTNLRRKERLCDGEDVAKVPYRGLLRIIPSNPLP